MDVRIARRVALGTAVVVTSLACGHSDSPLLPGAQITDSAGVRIVTHDL
jgi:hypothetical protein